MTDLDTRIRSYARGWVADEDPPPDLDAALERVVLTPHRRPGWVWSGLAAACIVGLAVIVSLAATGSSGSGTPAGTHPVAGPSRTAEQSMSLTLRERERAAAAAAQRALVTARLKAVAIRAATANGDPDPTAATAVRTTRQLAVSVTSGDIVSGPDSQVWVIEVSGDFVCGGCSVPPGAKTPRGRYLTLIVTAADLDQQTDFGIGDRRTDLARLGPVVTLLP